MTKCKHEFTGIPYLSRCGMGCNICSIFREFGSVEISEKDVDEICKEEESYLLKVLNKFIEPPDGYKWEVTEYTEVPKTTKLSECNYEYPYKNQKGVWSYLLKKFIEGYGVKKDV